MNKAERERENDVTGDWLIVCIQASLTLDLPLILILQIWEFLSSFTTFPNLREFES